MKKIIWLLCLLYSISMNCIAQEVQEGIHFEDLSHKEALVKAMKLNKKVFVDCYTQTCGPCKMMARNVFPQKVCGDYFNPLYVSIKKDMQQGDGLDIAKKYNVRMYPTFLILNPDGTLFLRYEGGAERDATLFVEKIKDQILLQQMEKTYKGKVYDDSFLNNFMDLLEKYDALRLQKVMEEVMNSWNSEQLCKPESWNRIKRVLRNPDNKLFRRIFSSRNTISHLLGKEEVANFIMFVYNDEFRTMKAMDLNWSQRLNDLDSLINENYPSARLLKCRITCYQTIKVKDTTATDYLLQVVKNLLNDYSTEKERIDVLKEMRGIHRLISNEEQRQDFYSALEKMLPHFTENPELVKELMNSIK